MFIMTIELQFQSKSSVLYKKTISKKKKLFQKKKLFRKLFQNIDKARQLLFFSYRDIHYAKLLLTDKRYIFNIIIFC